MKNKKLIISIILIIIGLAAIYRYSDLNWTYLQYNDELYVLNGKINREQASSMNYSLIGEVEKKIMIFYTPDDNNESNGIPEGTPIYSYGNGSIIIEYKNEFYDLSNTATTDGWGNGFKIRLG